MLSNIIQKGREKELPVFEAIKDITNEDGKVNIYFHEKKEPELVEYNKNRYVACLLYTKPFFYEK